MPAVELELREAYGWRSTADAATLLTPHSNYGVHHFMAKPTTRWRLAFARRLLHRALFILDDPSPFGPAEAVMAAQDGVELALWAIVDENNYKPERTKGGQVSFHALVEAVPTAQSDVKSLDALNQLRVQAKHFGTVVGRTAAYAQIQSAIASMRRATAAEAPNIDVMHAWLATSLENRLVARFFEEAERILDDESRRKDFAEALAKGVHFVLLHAAEVMDTNVELPKRSTRTPIADAQAAKEIEALRDATQTAFDDVNHRALVRSLAGEPAAELALTRLLPRVAIFADSTIRLRWSSEIAQIASLDPSTRELLLLAAVRMAEQVEAMDRGLPPAFGFQLPGVSRTVHAEAEVLVDGTHETLGALRPDRRYLKRGRDDPNDPYVKISMFGLAARVPRAKVA